MAKDKTASTEEARSDTCSDLSHFKSKPSDDSQSCSAELSDNSSSSNRIQSGSDSKIEECLAREICLKNSQAEDCDCPGCLEEQCPTCSDDSAFNSSKCCLGPERSVARSKSSSEYTESNATTSSSKAVSAGKSPKNKKIANSKYDSSDHTKTREDAKTDENKSGWSLSEDVILRSLKEARDGLSWDDIGKSLNRGKSECKSRWKVIKDQLLQDTSLEYEEKKNAEQGKQSSAETKAVTKDNAAKTSAPASEKGATDDAENAILPSSLEGLTEYNRQRQYWREHIGRHLYPASIRVEPDAHFSQSDCLVLEMIDARYQSMRWQEAQARFYNETGRMVSLEMIRRKCEDAAIRTEVDIAGWLDSIPD